MVCTEAYGNALSTVKKSRPTGETRCQPWDLSWVETSARQVVVSFKTWSRRSLSCGRAETCRDQSNVWNSRRPWRVTLNFETKILRSDIFAQVNLISAPKFEDRSQEERVARARCPRSSVEAGQKCFKKLKEHERGTFFSPSDNRCLPAFKS